MGGKRKTIEAEVKTVDDPVAQAGIEALLDSELVAKMRKKHGENIIQRADLYEDSARFRIPTGIFPLDYALGGGIAVGRFTTFYGPKSSSKTSTALRAIGNAQKMCVNCWIPFNLATGEIQCTCGETTTPVTAYINTEQSWDKNWVRCLRADPEIIAYSAPNYGEQAIDVTEALIESGRVHIVLFDSLADIVPTAEIEKGAEEGMMGDQPRLIGRAVRKFLAAMGRCERDFGFKPTVIMINQIRFKLGVMFGNPEIQPGGQAPGFVNTTEVRLQPKASKAEISDAMTGADSVLIEFRITKQKAGSGAYREGEFGLVLRNSETKRKGDTIDEPQILRMAEHCGALVREGAKWEILGESFRKKEDVHDRLVGDLEFSHRMRTELMKTLLENE